MGKRKKKVTTRRTTASKKAKSEEEEEQPSSSKDEDDLLFSSPHSCIKDSTAENKDEDNSNKTLPCNELDTSVCITEPPDTNNNDEVSPESPNEFIFAPLEHPGEASSTEGTTTTTVQHEVPSTSTSEEVIPFLTSSDTNDGEVAKTSHSAENNENNSNNSNSNELDNNSNHSNSNTIEVIDVDELPDTPTSSIGDDVIEITPSNSNTASRSNSPDVIVNRQVVDLTGAVDVVEGLISDYHRRLEEREAEEDVFLSLWSAMHHENPNSSSSEATTSACSSSSSNTQSDSNKNEEDSESSSSAKLHCPICMDDFAQIIKNRRLYSTSCGHVFCGVCVKAAVETQKRCPTCRKKQTMKNLHPIFL